MREPTFPGALEVVHEDVRVELLPVGLRDHHATLVELQPAILNVAARSRGWETPEEIQDLAVHFKLGPLFEANAIALIWKDDQLAGLAATVNDWFVDDLAIVHLCGLGFLRTIQHRGLLPALMNLVVASCKHDPARREALDRGRLYFSAISQSPFVLAFLSRAFTTFPAPGGAPPDETTLRVAEEVRKRFNPQLALEVPQLVLRDECRFFYKRTPYSADRDINALCNRTLRYAHGDVFIIVSHPTRGELERLEARFMGAPLARRIRSALPASPAPVE